MKIRFLVPYRVASELLEHTPTQAKNFTTNVPKNSRSQIVFRTDFFRKLTLGAPVVSYYTFYPIFVSAL